MRFNILVSGFCAVVAAAASAFAGPAANISGDYVEIRSCDVFTGPCFANGEMNLAGSEAILTWSVRQGGWDGVPLAGLKVVAVVKAENTLGNVTQQPQAGHAVLVIDSKADSRQRDALVKFARHMAGSLVTEVAKIEQAPIEVQMNPSTCHENGCSLVRAEGLVEVQTRCLGGKDHVCGNEERYYPPLTKIDLARPAYTEAGLFQGDGLGITFDEADRRSAYLGTFEL